MTDPLVRLSDVIEIVLKSEKRDRDLISSEALLTHLLQHFKSQLPIDNWKPEPPKKPPHEFN